MKSVKTWLMAVLILAVLGGSAVLISTGGDSAVAQERAAKTHWHYHDGHWGYWYEPDKRWYYTDGTNWYYSNDEGAWNVYRFDKQFGRDEFERGDYRVPDEGAKVVVPRHRVYRNR